MSETLPFRARDEVLWAAFIAAKRRAEQTENIEDGLACRRAWMAFMYATERQQEPAKVIPMRGVHAR